MSAPARAVGAGLLVLAGVLATLGTTAGIAYACDPVTLEGCDMTSPSTPTAPPPRDDAPDPAPPRPRPTSPPGEPFVPPDAQVPAPIPTPSAPVVPSAPPTTSVGPVEPSSAVGSESDSGGGGPGRLGLLVPAVVLGGVGIAALARQRPKPEDMIGEYQRICAVLCRRKAWEDQAEHDIDAALRQLRELDIAWNRARAYLRDQLREDYIRARWNETFRDVGYTILGGPIVWVGSNLLHVTGIRRIEGLNFRKWNAEVNEALLGGQLKIDRMRQIEYDRVTRFLTRAYERRDTHSNARHMYDSQLSHLRAKNPEIQFPACNCP